MTPDDATSTAQIEDRLQQLGRYSRFVRVGLGVIVGAFLPATVAVLPDNLESVSTAVDAILVPLIFVGMGLLLFGIGMQLHLLHQNMVRQLRESGVGGADSSDGRGEQ